MSKKSREQGDKVVRDLDEALEEMFPAGDPLQLTHPPTEDQAPFPRSCAVEVELFAIRADSALARNCRIDYLDRRECSGVLVLPSSTSPFASRPLRGRTLRLRRTAGCTPSQSRASFLVTEMGFLRKPPKGLMTPASGLLRAVGFMFDDRHQNNAVHILWRSLSRRWLAIGGRIPKMARSSARVWADPFLPVILLGVVAAAFGFAFILSAPPEIVFGVLAIGGVTAYLETKQRN